jgi:hypothetical protein
MTNPLHARCRDYRLELRRRSCGRTFSPYLYKIDGALIVHSYCLRCRPMTAIGNSNRRRTSCPATPTLYRELPVMNWER